MLLLAGLLIASAAEPDLRLSAEDFALSTDTDRRVKRSLARMFRVYEDELGLSFPARTPIHVQLIADRATYEREARAIGLTAPTLGFFSPRLGRGVVWRNTSAAAMEQTLLHEASHYLMSKGGAHSAPLWLHEGMAVLFGHARTSGNAVYLDPPPGVAPWVERAGPRWPPLSELLSSPAQVARLPGTPVGPAPYGVGWAICAFLMSRPHGKRLLAAFFALPRGQVGAAMVRTAKQEWPGGLGQLDRDWQAWFPKAHQSIQLPITTSATTQSAEGWIRCTNGMLIREGTGMRCPP